MPDVQIEVRRVGGKGIERDKLWSLESWQAITDGLILELVDRGWRRDWLESAKQGGWAYSRMRDALVRRLQRR